MKKFKQLLALTLVLVFAVGMCPDPAALAAEIVARGECGTNGNNLTWTLDSDWTLTISGHGEMADYFYPTSPPWYRYRENIKTVIIENGVHSIGAWAFTYFYALESMTIPGSVQSIGTYAFCNSSLKSVTIPGNVQSIGGDAFAYCHDLENVTISDGVQTIGQNTFDGCKNLTEIYIPKSVTTIKQNAFKDCIWLKDVYYGGSEQDWRAIDFTEEGNTVLLYGATIHYNSEMPTPEPTEPPATDTPTTEPPATDVPTTEPPATDTPTTEPPATEEPVLGDLNGSGGLDSGDATLILRAVVGVGTPLTKEQIALADMNGNGSVDAGDATQILRIVVAA